MISGNKDAETKIISFSKENNGRKDYIALKEHYEGIEIHALDITKAERIIERNFYAGKKNPTCGGRNLRKDSHGYSTL